MDHWGHTVQNLNAQQTTLAAIHSLGPLVSIRAVPELITREGRAAHIFNPTMPTNKKETL